MTEITSFPKVSIIMPTYNRAAFIMQSIESVQKQTYSNWELIIVDDASEDNTAALVNGINDERIHYLPITKTGVGIKLRLHGVERATGELIAFIDSDDLWAKEKLAKQVNALRDHPGAAFSLT